MKNLKKLLLAIFAFSSAALCMTAFAACGEHEHRWGEWKETTPATCTEAGEEKHVCLDDPTHTETRVVDAKGHNWGVWTVTDANKPTESKEGKATRTCANAGCDAGTGDKEYTLPALSSEAYKKGTDSATCTSGGSVEYSYDKDGVKVKFEVATSEKNHSLTRTEAEAATCTEDGTLEYWTCSDCGKKFGDANGENEVTAAQLVDPAGHKLSHVDAKPAACAADGTLEHWTCSGCGKKFSDANGENEVAAAQLVDPKGHKLFRIEAVPATCTENGILEHWACSGCDKKFSDANGENEVTDVVVPARHEWDDGEVTTPPTETTTGVKTYTCTVPGCGATKTEPIPELGHEHSFTGEWQKDEDGHWKVCDGVGCYEVGLSAPHSWNSGTVTTEPTCNSAGVKTFTCTVEGCGATKTESVDIDASAHDWGEWTSKTAATCSAPAVEQHICANNPEHTETRNVGEANPEAHVWGEWTEKTPADCLNAKVEERVCSLDSSHKETRTAGEALGHNFSWAVTTNPTFDSEGIATITCSHSGCDVTDEKVLPSLSTAGVYTVTDNTAKCEEDGTARYKYAYEGGEVSFTAPARATGHRWSEWLVNIGDDGGEASKSCVNYGCQAEKHTDLPALSEKDQYKYEDSSTCEMSGSEVYIFVYSDDDGSEEILVKNEAVPAKGHDWGEWTEKTPATCITGKVEERACLRDEEHTETRTVGEVNPEAHEEKTLNAVAATCTEDGLTEGKSCSVCLKILEEQAVVKAKGHSLSTTATPSVNETDKTVSNRCTVCNMLVVYEYDNAVLNASGTVNSPSSLSDGVNYVTQSTINPYLSYTFTEAGTYTFYWVRLNNDTFNLNPATLAAPSGGFINTSKNLLKANIPEGFAIEGYATGSLQYYVDNVSTTAQAGDYLILTKNSLQSSQNQLSLTNFVTVKLTFTVTEEMATANTIFKFRNVTSSTGGCFLVGVNKEPTICAELCSVGAGNFTVKDTELEFTKITEDTAGTYTFTAKTGTFKLYVNGEVYSDGEKDFFGYADFRDRYLIVTLDAGDEVKVEKLSNRASDNTVTIHEGELEEPAESEYNTLELGDQTITLSSTNRTSSNYEGDGEVEATERFYSFTATESGYYEISVADDVRVTVVIRVDRIHYTTVLDVVNMNKHSGVIYMEDGETVIIAFLNNNVEEFNVNIASCKEPITYLEVNEKLENIAFSGFETVVKLTVGDSVAEGKYKLIFKASNSLLRSYIYFTIGEDIKVEDKYDSNGIAAYVNADIEAGANNTVGAGTSEKSDWDEDYTRTITVKAGDVIYLATTSLTPGYVDITLEAVAE